MAPSGGPCGWYFRPWFAKAECQNKPSKAFSSRPRQPLKNRYKRLHRNSHLNPDLQASVSTSSAYRGKFVVSKGLYGGTQPYLQGERSSATITASNMCHPAVGAAKKTWTAACSCVHFDLYPESLHSVGILMISGALRKAHAVLRVPC